MANTWKDDPTEIPSRIEISIAVPGGKPVVCAVNNMTVHGAHVHISAEEAPALRVGGRAELLITDAPSGTSVVIPAVADVRDDRGQIRSYRVRFTDADAVAGLLHPGLVGIFDRREAFRARPAANKPLDIIVEPPEGCSVPPLLTDVVDLSTTGIAVDVPVEFESEMILFDHVNVTFKLAGHELVIRGFIRHRSWKESDRVRYGVEFDVTSEKFEFSQECISTWVLTRQIALRKSAA